MTISKKALSLLLALTIIVGTFASTAAFATSTVVYDSDSGSWYDSNVSDSGVVDSNNAWTNVDFKDSAYSVDQTATLNLIDEIQVQKADKDSGALTGIENYSDYIVAGSWTSSNPAVATVDSGNVTPVSAGTTTITVQVKGTYRVIQDSNCSAVWTLSCEVTVNPVAVSGITLNTSALSLQAGKTSTLVSTVTPSNATDPAVAWSSSDPSVATVTNSGLVTAIKAGTATITAAAGYVSATCTVTVTPAETFISDTNVNFNVNGIYQFKITSKNGQAPTLIVGTAGIFTTQLVKKAGNEYFFKLTAIGTPGAKSGIFVNGVKLLVATVTAPASTVKSDTTGSFKVKTGKSYTFKITATSKPSFVAGTSSAFKIIFVKAVGMNYFFKATAIGKSGKSSGFYINSQKSAVAVATIS